MKYTDQQLLLNCFHSLIHKENSLHANLTGDLSYWFRDGFEEKIDEDLLSPFMHDLARRCGYVLVDGMWEDKKALEEKKMREANTSLLDIIDGIDTVDLTTEQKKILDDNLLDLL